MEEEFVSPELIIQKILEKVSISKINWTMIADITVYTIIAVVIVNEALWWYWMSLCLRMGV